MKIDHELTDGEFDVMSISITEASQLGVASGRFQMGATYNRLFHGRGGPLDHPMHGYATIDFMERLVPHRPR